MSRASKPTLGGQKIRTRKRNVVIPYDPDQFRSQLTEILLKGRDQPSDSLATTLASTEGLDFNRYADHFLDVVLTGGCGASVGKYRPDAEMFPLSFCGTEGLEHRQESVNLVVQLTRRLPFLQPHIETAVQTLMNGYPSFNERLHRDVTELIASLMVKKFVPGRLLLTMTQNDPNVESGLVLDFLTQLIANFILLSPADKLMKYFQEGGLDLDKLLTFFPSSKRHLDAFAAHFTDLGMTELVALTRERQLHERLTQTKTELTALVADPTSTVDIVKAKIDEFRSQNQYEDIAIVKLIWDSILGSVDRTRGQQISDLLLAQCSRWAPLLKLYVTSPRLQADLINYIQGCCYDDPPTVKCFADFIRLLYDNDVLEEDPIRFWYQRGSGTRGRPVFVVQLEPMIKWLETAEEESDDDEA